MNEHDVVVLVKDFNGIPSGNHGTIVHVYISDVFEVEFKYNNKCFVETVSIDFLKELEK